MSFYSLCSTTGIADFLSCLWDGAHKQPLLLIEKSSPCSDGSGFPLSLSEWSFTISMTPYNHKIKNVLSVPLNKTFPPFPCTDDENPQKKHVAQMRNGVVCHDPDIQIGYVDRE